MYRLVGMQVVPAMSHRENRNQWKRPALPKWRELENELIPDFTFERWYGEGGEHARRNNMGMIAGNCSNGLFVIDLDVQKDVGARAWWDEILHLRLSAGELETVEQQTGGGGVHLFFRAPPGWTPPTCKTNIGVDIRGQGGFAMMPPSTHESGKPYRWKEGHEPWTTEAAEAPEWLCHQIDQLAAEDRKSPPTGSTSPSARTPGPAQAVNAFGGILDGREDYMTRMVWAAVLDFYREAPIPLIKGVNEEMLLKSFATYERKVKSRLHANGVSNAERLEREGRGISMFRQKWNNAIDQWDGKVAEHAAMEKPTSPFDQADEPHPFKFYKVDEKTGELFVDVETPTVTDIYEFLDIDAICRLPKSKYLIDKLMIEAGLGFVYGPPGCGKSFITIGMGLSICAQRADWFGRSINKSGPVVYISSEGVGDIGLRIDAWEKEAGVKASGLPFYLIRQTINFMAQVDVERLLRTVAEIGRVVGKMPVTVFVDTVSRVLPGADENLQKDMTLFIGACDAIRTTFGATVVGVHHISRAGNMRGSTVFDGAGDFLLGIEREEGEMVGEIHARKIKSAEDGWRQGFELKKVVVNDITSETSLYAMPSCQPVTPYLSLDDERMSALLDIIDMGLLDNQGETTGALYTSAANSRARWVGIPIMTCLDCTNLEAKKIAKRLISSQILTETSYPDGKQMRKGLKVNPDKRAAKNAAFNLDDTI